MENVRCNWARPVVIALICLSGASAAFAQGGGGSGTLVGTVVDGTGAALPGATVNATEVSTGSVRTRRLERGRPVSLRRTESRADIR